MRNTRIKSRCLDDLTDQERLHDRFEWEGFTEIKIKSDGNCQFRALADQLYGSSGIHKQVRQEIVKQLKSCPKAYKGFVDKTEFSQYVKNMSSDSVWGDEVTLKAAADLYGVKIVLMTSIKDNPSIVILPMSEKVPGKVIHLSYLAGIHYNSIHLNKGSDTASMELKKKKKNNKYKEKEKKKNDKHKDTEEEVQKEKANERNKNKNNKEKKNHKENKNKQGLHRQSDYSDVM